MLETQTQRISNVTVIQEGQKLRIKYELTESSLVEVALYISENNGNTWMKVSQHLSGDVGPNVSGGSKEMIWDVLQARENLVGNSIVFKVKVGSEIKSIKIGNQVWMAENLNVDHYRNGDPIPTGLFNAQWETTTNGAYAIYKDDPANEELYGKLYNWYAVSDTRGLCPAGWHVPKDDEWTILAAHLGGSEIAGGKMKATTGWSVPNDGATNSSGFNALPGGYRYYQGEYGFYGDFGHWWSSTSDSYGGAWFRELASNDSNLDRKGYGNKRYGFSVRCVKDYN